MNTVCCLLVDDEPLAREMIQTYLSKMPGWEVVGTCINAEEAYEVLMQSTVDVLFLDIQMPIISGIDFLRSLKNPPLVVFTTAYSQYATEGFDLNVVDYLLKPITIDRFFQAVEKVKERLAIRHKLPEEEKEVQTPYFFIKHNGKFIKVNFQDILYVKAERDFSSIYVKDKRLFVSMHLKLLEDILPEKLFTKVHRSYIIHHAMVTSLYGNMLQIGTIELPIGSKFKEELYRKLNIS